MWFTKCLSCNPDYSAPMSLFFHRDHHEIQGCAFRSACIKVSSLAMPLGSKFSATDPLHRMGSSPARFKRCFAPKAMGMSGMLTENRNEITKCQFETTFANKGFEKSLHHLTLNDCTFHNLKPSKSSACGTKEMDSRSFFRSISPTFTPRERLATWSSNPGDTESAHG